MGRRDNGEWDKVLKDIQNEKWKDLWRKEVTAIGERFRRWAVMERGE